MAQVIVSPSTGLERILRGWDALRDYDLEATTLWDFEYQSPAVGSFGDARFNGVTPAGIVTNLVRRYTRPGDLVVDPMAGCYDEATDVLTRDGWKPWREASAEDDYATLIDGRLEYRRAINIVKVWHDGPMYRVRTKLVDLLVTPDHWLYVGKRHSLHGRYGPQHLVRAEDAFGKNVRYRKDALWEGEERAFFELPEIKIHHQVPHAATLELVFPRTRIPMDAWLRFIGHWLTDGSCTADRGSYNIKLSQVKPASRPAFRASLVEIAGRLRRPLRADPPHIFDSEVGFTIRHKQLGTYLSGLGKKTERRLPRDLLTVSPRQLGILYDALLDGDGHRRRPGERGGTDTFYTSSPTLRDAFQELCLKLGWAATIGVSALPGELAGKIKGRQIRTKTVAWGLSVNKRQLRPRVYISRNRYDRADRRNVEFWDHYRGYVYCANVPPSHVLYVRRNGRAVWCGNSGTTVDVARALARRVLAFDIAPQRPDIARNDARHLPLLNDSVDLHFVDPPYSDNVRYSGDPACLGRIPAGTAQWLEAMEQVARELHRTLKPGHVLGWLICDEYRRGRFTPIGFHAFEFLHRYFEPVDIVCIVRHHDRSLNPMWEHRARKFGFYLRGFKYLFIVRKPTREAIFP